MSDLFQDAVPDEYIAAAATIMLRANRLTYQVLAKRADRLQQLLTTTIPEAAMAKHIWWGVSVRFSRPPPALGCSPGEAAPPKSAAVNGPPQARYKARHLRNRFMAKKAATPNYEMHWVLRDRKVIDGLDHLGIELVSVNLYQSMLPGLTNVTERARYYAFYPWTIHRYAQEGPKERSKRTWRTWFRSLDFAYAAACIAYEQKNQVSLGSSIVGADKASALIAGKQPGETIALSTA